MNKIYLTIVTPIHYRALQTIVMNICDVCLILMKSHTIVMKATLSYIPFLKVSRAEGVRDLSVPLTSFPKTCQVECSLKLVGHVYMTGG